MDVSIDCSDHLRVHRRPPHKNNDYLLGYMSARVINLHLNDHTDMTVYFGSDTEVSNIVIAQWGGGTSRTLHIDPKDLSTTRS